MNEQKENNTASTAMYYSYQTTGYRLDDDPVHDNGRPGGNGKIVQAAIIIILLKSMPTGIHSRMDNMSPVQPCIIQVIDSTMIRSMKTDDSEETKEVVEATIIIILLKSVPIAIHSSVDTNN